MCKLNGTGGGKTGLGITLKVMAGDKLNIFGKSYYSNNSGTNLSNNSVQVLDLLAGFLGSPGAATTLGQHGLVTPALINTPDCTAGISAMLQNQNNESSAAPTIPGAYINYVFFDEQIKYATGASVPAQISSIFIKCSRDYLCQLGRVWTFFTVELLTFFYFILV